MLRCQGDAASLCARSRGEPSSAHCEQRLSERLTPRPCDPVCACTGIRGHVEKGTSRQKAGKTMQPRSEWQPASFVSDPTRSAASRDGMAGWAGEGGGRFGERREYEAPTLPSTPRQHGAARHQTRQPGNVSRETAHHHKRQARTATQPNTPAKKQHATTKASTTKTARRTRQRVHPAFMQPATQSAA